jgi:carboxyl-terminal processing protease
LDESAVPEAFEAGLLEIVARLDSHSYVLSPEQRARQRQAAGAGVTTGVTIDRRDGVFVVAGVVPRSPAAQAGLEVGAKVVAIDGDASFRSAAGANLLLHGSVGEVRTLELEGPEGLERVKLRIVATQRVSIVESKVVEHGGRRVAVLCVHAFWDGVGENVRSSLRRVRRDGVDRVVLDLRRNPGGELEEALIVADALVPSGLLMRTRGRHGAILREELAHSAGTDTESKVVVLIDRHTASAAELLAMSLRDHGRARVVGETSFGKGTVQARYGLSDGSLLSLTIARYFGPADRTPDGVGVSPDVRVEPGPSALARAVALAAAD